MQGAQPGRSYHDRDEGYAFTLGIRFNSELDFLEVLSFWAEGVGVATYLAAILSNSLYLAVTGLLFVVIAVAALVAHLGKAGRSWRVPANIATAWVSRGSLIIAGFVGSGLTWSYLSFADTQGPYRPLAFLVSFAFAVILMFYAGWLLRSIKAVKLWNGALVPVTFVSHSLASGIIILAGLNWMSPTGTEFTPYVSQIALAALVCCSVLTVMHLRLAGKSLAVQASLARLFNGDLKLVFLGAGMTLGIVVPFLLIIALTWSHDAIAHELVVSIAVVAVASRLAGDLAYRYAFVRAGAYEPIL